MAVLTAAILSAALMIAAGWGYVRQVRAEADPRLASWAIWTAAMTVAAAGAGVTGQWPAAAQAGAGAVGCAAVLVAGWRHGSRRAGVLDWAGLAAGGGGVLLLAVALAWPGLMPVWAAVAVAVGTDVAAFLPSWANGWAGREPARPYLLYAAAAVAVLVVADPAQPAGVLFAAYEALACTGMVVLVVVRRAAEARVWRGWVPSPDPARWPENGLREW